jgi:hypothetical protein
LDGKVLSARGKGGGIYQKRVERKETITVGKEGSYLRLLGRG